MSPLLVSLQPCVAARDTRGSNKNKENKTKVRTKSRGGDFQGSMGGKQSSQAFDGRTRAYSSSDLPSVNPGGGERIAGFRYTNGPDGPRIRITGGGPASSGLSIPTGGMSASRALNQSLDATDGVDEDQLSPEGHRLLIGSLPAHLSPHLLGGKLENVENSKQVILKYD